MWLIKHKKAASTAVILLTGLIVFCPHEFHLSACAAPCDAGHDEHAYHGSESDHDHGHCEIDAMHSHDFRLPPSSGVQPLSQAAARSVVEWVKVPVRINVGHTVATLFHEPGPPLKALDSIRLLI
jgi:hypothetical protein